MSSIDLALLQVAVRDDESPQRRFERGMELLRGLERPVRLAIFPELWAVGFFSFDEYERSSELLEQFKGELASAARELGIWLHGGSFVEKSAAGNLHNLSLLYSPTGELRSTYRKIHLFGFESKESQLLTPGEDLALSSTELGSCSLSTCYDLRFPELYRAYGEMGATVHLVTSAWPFPRLEHWLTMARARAVENLSYVVACNAAGSTRGSVLLGNSVVVDPWGVPCARAGEEEGVLYARIDPDKVEEVRSRFPALTDRRDIEEMKKRATSFAK